MVDWRSWFTGEMVTGEREIRGEKMVRDGWGIVKIIRGFSFLLIKIGKNKDLILTIRSKA